MASVGVLETSRRGVSPMTNPILFEGSYGHRVGEWKPYVGFDIETYSADGFPEDGQDPVVAASLAISPSLNPREGLMLVSLIYPPSKEKALLDRLSDVLSSLGEGFLVTYNGKRFDVPYALYRGVLNGIDLRGVFAAFRHIDLYEAVRRSGIRLYSYGQKAVELSLGIGRALPDFSGATYHVAFDEFLRRGDLKPLIYNIEDTVGCLHILNGLRRVGVSVALSR